MQQDRDARARQIFMELLDLPAEQRAEYLRRACYDDDALRAEVSSLLAADDRADRFMNRPTATAFSGPDDALVGTQVGPYKLLQQIGEGGFGTVYLAEQFKPIRRRVAVKILKPGMDTRQVIARFEAERQALAMMDHPHIAGVLDAGETESGRPYFVMEYVVGDAITAFADAHKLSVRARLELFLQVCSAVQHAHTKGIIHRDIKPGNVLVSLTDGRAFARVIDFGIAKATAAVLTDKTLFTEHHQLIGTLEYMSPEQAEGLPDIDTRTDVYSLGVLLYELLTGQTPLDGKRLRSAAWHEMRRMIQEEEPPIPSVRLHRALQVNAELAALRCAEPVGLGAQVRGELDWITSKALDKDRRRRFETASALADDVRRHLDGESVTAAPPSRVYQWQKFVRRNRGLVSAIAAVGLALGVGIVGTSLGLWRAEQANDKLTRQSDTLAKSAYKANLALAQLAIENANWPEARDLLGDCPASERGWEWQYLSNLAGSVHAAFPTTFAKLSPDGKTMAVTQTSRNVLLKDLDGRPISRPFLAENDRWITLLAWAGNDRIVVELRSPAEILVFDRSGRVVAGPMRYPESPQPRRRWTMTRVSPDGRWILMGDQQRNLILWHADGRRTDVVFPHDGPIHQADFSSDGTRLVTYARRGEGANDASPEAVVRVWDVNGAMLTEMPQVGAHQNDRFVLSPDGDLVFVSSDENTARLCDLSGAVVALFEGTGLNNAMFSPDGSLLLTHHRRGAQLWNLDGTRRGVLVRDPATLSAVFASDGQSFFTVSSPYVTGHGATDNRIRQWDLDGAPIGASYSGQLDPSTIVASPDGEAVLLRGSFDYMTERSLRIPLPFRTAYGLLGANELTPLRVAAILDVDVEDALVDAVTPRALELDSTAVASAVSPDGKRLVTGAGDTISFWEPITGRKLLTLRMVVAVRRLGFSPDGMQFVVQGGVGWATALDIRSLEEQAQAEQAHWDARLAARGFLDDLLDGRLSNDDLLDALVHEGSIDPQQRLAAGELLTEQLHDFKQDATAAFRDIIAGQVLPETVRQRAADAALPRRVKEYVIDKAARWKPDD